MLSIKLVTPCKSCKKDIAIKSVAATRPDLQMQMGDEFRVNCQNCGTFDRKHVNDISAKQNNLLLLLGIAISIAVSLLLWNVYGAIGTISILIPVYFWYQQMAATRGFNSYRIRRK